MATARRDKEGWIRCERCGHKLAKVVGVWEGRNAFPALETKCHSCGTLNYIYIGGQKNDRTRQA